jgi:hypothetical protein
MDNELISSLTRTHIDIIGGLLCSPGHEHTKNVFIRRGMKRKESGKLSKQLNAMINFTLWIDDGNHLLLLFHSNLFSFCSLIRYE